MTLLLAKLLSAPFIDQSTIDRYFQLCQHLLAGNQIRPLQQFLRKSMYLFIAACYDPQAYGNFLLQLNEHRELLSIALTAKHENGISALIILAGEAPRLYLQLLTLLMESSRFISDSDQSRKSSGSRRPTLSSSDSRATLVWCFFNALN